MWINFMFVEPGEVPKGARVVEHPFTMELVRRRFARLSARAEMTAVELADEIVEESQNKLLVQLATGRDPDELQRAVQREIDVARAMVEKYGPTATRTVLVLTRSEP